jgi:N-acetylglucosamine kinase-like BadF-type ATPase
VNRAGDVRVRLVAGIDAGGTKTDAVVCDVTGGVLGHARASGGNWEIVGLDGAVEVVTRVLDDALEVAGAGQDALEAVAFALAGLDWPSDRAMLDGRLAVLAPAARRTLVNDAFAAMRAGTRLPYGCVSVAGTGSVSAGRNQAGETFRTMGNGYGEGSGASGIVHEALNAVARARNGCAPETLLAERFLAALGDASVDALFERLIRAQDGVGADYARLVLQAAADGDEAAIAVARGEGRRLGAGVAGVARRLGMLAEPFEVVRSGGVNLAGSAELDAAFLAVVREAAPLATVGLLDVPPVAGAALLALDLLDEGTPAARERLAAGLPPGATSGVEAAA